MFANAYRIASRFTLPVIISSRTSDNVCTSIIGACVVINSDGWILTTAHLINEIQRQQASVAKYHTHNGDVRQLEQDIVADKYFRKNKVHAIHRPSTNSIKNCSIWWGSDTAQLQFQDVAMIASSDLAIGRLDGFKASTVEHYPIFKKPDADYTPGRSLCRLGFPFHEIKPSYDSKQNRFTLPAGTVPVPLFPIDGIFTRVIVAPMQGVENGEVGKFIETSSPGLCGQSGGPIVDVNGAVWALQSHTRHYALGFSPPVPGNNKSNQHKEHQFLNVGLGVHNEPILHLLKEKHVDHQTC